MLIFYCMLASFQAFAVYLSYTLANRGEEIRPKGWGICVLLFTAGAIGGYYAMKQTSDAVDFLILLAYFVSVGILFSLVTNLTKLRAMFAGLIYFAISILAWVSFKLLFF